MGANVDHLNRDGQSSIDLAIQRENNTIVQLLGNVTIRSPGEWYPVHMHLLKELIETACWWTALYANALFINATDSTTHIHPFPFDMNYLQRE